MSTTSQQAAQGRTAELEFEINAPVEQVWEAISEAKHLMNWFPLEARVNPGEGGTMFMAWGEAFQGECEIEVWEPNKRLRTTFMDNPSGGGEPMRTFVDYYLEGKGGVTKLRLVHSGFGKGAAWDALYDGVSRGWNAELRSLRHYLENHFGERRHVAWSVKPFAQSESELWPRLMGPEGLGVGSYETLKAGDRFRADGPAMGAISGTVLHVQPNGVFVATVDELDNAWMRVELERCSGPDPSVWFWVSLFGDSSGKAETLTGRIGGALDALVA